MKKWKDGSMQWSFFNTFSKLVKVIFSQTKGTPLWKALIFESRIPYRYHELNLFYPYFRWKNKRMLRKIIIGKRVVILGSGPSSKQLKSIPSDCKVLACRYSPKILIDKKIKRKIDLYYSSVPISEVNDKNGEFHNMLRKTEVGCFITNTNTEYFKFLRKYSSKLSFDKSKYNYYLKKLIKPVKVRNIKGNSSGYCSSGMFLLQCALYFKAKEIYMVGIDLTTAGHFYSKKKNPSGHMAIDHNFMKIASKKFQNIFTAVKSPITEYISFKKLI